MRWCRSAIVESIAVNFENAPGTDANFVPRGSDAAPASDVPLRPVTAHGTPILELREIRREVLQLLNFIDEPLDA